MSEKEQLLEGRQKVKTGEGGRREWLTVPHSGPDATDERQPQQHKEEENDLGQQS